MAITIFEGSAEWKIITSDVLDEYSIVLLSFCEKVSVIVQIELSC